MVKQRGVYEIKPQMIQSARRQRQEERYKRVTFRLDTFCFLLLDVGYAIGFARYTEVFLK